MKENGSSMETGETKGRKRGQSGGAATEGGFGGQATGASTASSGGGMAGEILAGEGEIRERLDEARRDLRSDVEALSETVGHAAQEMGSYVREQLRERPYAALGAAAGLGFVLGGGLTLRVGSLLFGTGGRMLASMVLREVLRPTAD